MDSTQPPTEADWRSEPWCLDCQTAYKNFRGKTIDEAIRLFEESSLRYQEDLMFMPSRVFGYYVRAFGDYLISPAAHGDSDGASCFIALIEFKATHAAKDLYQIWNEIHPTLNKVAEEQDSSDVETYGDFRARIRAIEKRSPLPPSHGSASS